MKYPETCNGLSEAEESVLIVGPCNVSHEESS